MFWIFCCHLAWLEGCGFQPLLITCEMDGIATTAKMESSSVQNPSKSFVTPIDWLVNRDCHDGQFLSLLNRVAYNPSIQLVNKDLGHCFKYCQLEVPLLEIWASLSLPETTPFKVGDSWDSPDLRQPYIISLRSLLYVNMSTIHGHLGMWNPASSSSSSATWASSSSSSSQQQCNTCLPSFHRIHGIHGIHGNKSYKDRIWGISNIYINTIKWILEKALNQKNWDAKQQSCESARRFCWSLYLSIIVYPHFFKVRVATHVSFGRIQFL